MPDFEVRYHDPAQGVSRCRVTAARASAVAGVLGIQPKRLLSVRPLPASRSRHGVRLQPRLFAQELAVLLQAGIPLLEAMRTLREKDASAVALDTVIDALAAGQPLSTSLEAAGFDSLFVAVVAASERNGQLATTLRDHGAYLAWSDGLRARLLAASLYPLMLMGAGAAVILFLLLYVLPRFATVFDGLGRELPWASQALMSAGTWAHAHPVFTLLAAASLPLLIGASWHRPALRERLARGLWLLPLVGPGLRLLALARLYRCLALLLGAGVPVLPALRLAEGVLDAPLRPALRAAAAEVSGGRRLSQAALAHALATPVALRMLRVGESSGELASMLERAAAFHDEEIANFSENLTRVINPLLMLVMGVLIGGIVVLMYLPIFTLMEQVQ